MKKAKCSDLSVSNSNWNTGKAEAVKTFPCDLTLHPKQTNKPKQTNNPHRPLLILSCFKIKSLLYDPLLQCYVCGRKEKKGSTETKSMVKTVLLTVLSLLPKKKKFCTLKLHKMYYHTCKH